MCWQFTVFRSVLSTADVARVRSHLEPIFNKIFDDFPDAERSKLGDTRDDLYNNGRLPPLNDQPGGLMNHAVWADIEPVVKQPYHNDEVLDFAQLVIGPAVQLDGMGCTGVPPSGLERRGKLIKSKGGQGWHRVREPGPTAGPAVLTRIIRRGPRTTPSRSRRPPCLSTKAATGAASPPTCPRRSA